ncbi:hypothetical protein [Chelativorans sp. AA-79]|uniref:hypothetical protein n=1 Tax=Chelativorans sp. AA-79 TaxID=3028735 RepID=UPI0023F6438F|nr:hypothetical protein [Chelativorans sp. AA-79]WEX10243.1 hypothetical protein PVE73_04595 [Chelativorans sp. AA-79]
MLSSWLKPRRSTERPTTSIYFSECMRDEIGKVGSREHRVWALSPNIFYVPDASEPRLLVIRDWDPGARIRLAELPPAQIHYLLDDDIWAGSEDVNLPRAYRARLRRLRDGNARWLIRNAARIYVCSERLAERLGRDTATLLHPALALPPADLTHHQEEQLRLVFVGTRSHLGDLESIEPPLVRFLADHPDCVLETYLGRFAPASLRLSNAVHHSPQSWPAYRTSLAQKRYHIALAPALPTPFNAARSRSKILEISCFGAAPVYGSAVSFAGSARKARAGFFCSEAGDWYEVLSRLAGNRHLVRDAAAANRQLALDIGDPARLRNFWYYELGLTSRHEGVFS